MFTLRLAVTLTASVALLGFAGLAAGARAATHATPASAQESEDVQAPHPMRQFDFWVGEWDVYGRNGDLSGTNDIRPVSGGEMLLEEWRNTSGGRGTSLSWFEATDRRWHQMWITLGEGATESIGEWKDGSMRLVSKEDGRITGRCAWTPHEDGTVHQLWEQTTDGGQTWTTAADLIYERHADSED